MAFPADIGKIGTNIPLPELAEVIKAVENKEVSWIPLDLPVLGEFRIGNFDYRGARYEITEMWEVVDTLKIIQSEQSELPINLKIDPL